MSVSCRRNKNVGFGIIQYNIEWAEKLPFKIKIWLSDFYKISVKY